MPSGYGASSDHLSQRCRLATIGLVDPTVNFGGRTALYRSGAALSASTRSCVRPGARVDTGRVTEAAVTDCVATPLRVPDAPPPAPSSASTDQALRPLPAPALSPIDSCHAAKPAPAESYARTNRWGKMKSAKAAPLDSGPLLSAAAARGEASGTRASSPLP